ncbi:pectin acetylesterase 5-like isoform X2 [Miscanthus floridulus]|uniref:pectin acetylesterase 5-like isoform X2 n=1 Tax=Miscanthus floridulus TaxID=154761 RepID=UPI00345A5E0B
MCHGHGGNAPGPAGRLRPLTCGSGGGLFSGAHRADAPHRRAGEGRSVLGWKPAGLPLPERLRLRIPQLDRLSSAVLLLIFPKKKTQGGAWRSSDNTTETCSERKMTSYGSSKLMEAITFDGIFSNQQPQNPDFYNWNKVFVRYCDGASFSGDAEGEAQDGTKLFFRGSRIWDAVVDELMGKGMDTAKQALLAGCSAGGLATLVHCDNFRARFPQEVPVKCLPDGGFFLDVKDLSGERHMRSIFNGVVQLQNVSKVLPKDCLAKKDPTECFFPAELIKSISTPTFIVNSEYDAWQIANVVAPDGSYPGDTWSNCRANIRNCSSKQIDVLHGFRRELIRELKVAEGERDWGLFIDSCYTHCQTQSSDSWHSPTSPRLGNQTVAEAVGDWYFGRRRVVKQIDCEYPCNPTCSSQ